ncbi:MAG: hypothetical protein R2883_06505 [Caldisericia bacterium]
MAHRIIGDRFELIKSLNENQTLWESIDIESGETVLIRLLNVSKNSSRGWVRLESNLEEIKKIDSQYVVKTIEWGDCSEGNILLWNGLMDSLW